MPEECTINGEGEAAGMGSQQATLDNIQNIVQSMDAQVKRCQELLLDKALKGMYEAGRDDVILEQLIAKARVFGEITDATSYAEAGAMLSEMHAVEERAQKRQQELETESTQLKLVSDKFQAFLTEIGAILEAKIKAYEQRDGRCKLTAQNIIEAHQLCDAGMTIRKLAERYNVSPSTMSDALARRSWKNLSRHE